MGRFLKALSFLIPIVIKKTSFLTLLYSILSLILSAHAGLSIYVNRFFYDSIAEYAAGNETIVVVIYGAISIIILMLLRQVLSKIYGFIWTMLGDKIELVLLSTLNKKISQFGAQQFEDPYFLATLDKAHGGIFGSIGMIATLFEVFIYFLGYFVIATIYLWSINPILIVLIVLIFTPSFFVISFQSKIYAEEADDLVFLRRRATSFYNAAINHRETRLYGIFGYFYDLIKNTYHSIFLRKKQTELKNFRISLMLNIFRIVGWVGIVVFLMVELLKGSISVGAFTAVFTSIGTMFTSCESLLTRIKVDFSENLGMINDYIDFISMETPIKQEETVDYYKGIQLANVSFKYPGSDHYAVNNVTLSIFPKETVAFVGINGSGKTTLAKLLCGLYTPSEGSVTIGGVNSKTISSNISNLKSTAVFQNYMKYIGLSLEDKIRIGDFKSCSKIDKYLKIADILSLQDLPNSYNVMVGRSFDGVELSGGEWQRIAMARGLFRQHDLILLDEPTAAIDPIEEAKVYDLFSSYSKEKICILVTHRLGSIKLADRIFVMDNGRVVEQGTHIDLLNLNGKYKELWDAATKDYIN